VWDGVGHILDHSADQESEAAQQAKDRAHDPPSSDFRYVSLPTFRTEQPIAGNNDLQLISQRLFNNREQRRAYLAAWKAAYERYQGAQQAGEKESLLLQARAMLSFSDGALEASRSFCDEDRAWKAVLIGTLTDALHAVRSKSWDDLIMQARKNLNVQLPKAEGTNNRAAPQSPAGRSARLMSFSSQEARRTFIRAQLDLEYARGEPVNLLAMSQFLKEPADLPERLEMRELSRRLHDQVSRSDTAQQSHRSSDENIERTGLMDNLRRLATF